MNCKREIFKLPFPISIPESILFASTSTCPARVFPFLLFPFPFFFHSHSVHSFYPLGLFSELSICLAFAFFFFLRLGDLCERVHSLFSFFPVISLTFYLGFCWWVFVLLPARSAFCFVFCFLFILGPLHVIILFLLWFLCILLWTEKLKKGVTFVWFWFSLLLFILPPLWFCLSIRFDV